MEKHKSYDVKFKLKAVEVAKNKSIAAAAQENGVDRKRIWDSPSSYRYIYNQ